MVGINKAAVVLAMIATLTACDVVKLDADNKPILPQSTDVNTLANMTPAQIAEQIWPTQIMSQAKTSARDWQQLQTAQLALQQGQKLTGFFRLNGVVSKVDRSHRAGAMIVDVHQHPVTVQIGPIVRGNALRDSAKGVSFDAFKNQVQFARLSKALNKKALGGLPKLDSEWQGQPVTMIVAATVTRDGIKQAVPIVLQRGNADGH